MTDERRIDAVNVALVGAVERSGDVYVSSTRLFGRQAIRMCVLNPTTTAAHVHHALDIIETHAGGRAAARRAGRGRSGIPTCRPAGSRARRSRPTTSPGCRCSPAWSRDDVAALLERASERRLQAGETC